MPILTSPPSLKMACLGSIVQHLDTLWCGNYREAFMKNDSKMFRFIEGPFNYLDSDSIKEIARQVGSRGKMTKLYLNILIIPPLKEVDLSHSPKLVSDDILRLICIRCRGVKKLILNHCDRVSSSSLVNIVQVFHKTLTHLYFAGVKMSVQLLKTIGNCENLKVLSIDMCKVSNLGIKQLFFFDDNWTVTAGGKSLQVIRMLGCAFKDEIHLLSKILRYCPRLHCITHFGIWDSIAEICETDFCQPKLGLCGARHDMSLDLSSFEDRLPCIPQMVSCLPYLCHLSINNVKGMDIPLFQLITGFGRNLKSLNTDWVYPFSFIRYVGASCPGLDSLSINILNVPLPGQSCFFEAVNAFEQYLDSKTTSRNNLPWSKLEQISISWPSSHGALHVPSTAALLEIFQSAASSLRSVSLAHTPDQEINSLIIRCLDLRYFDKLEDFSVCQLKHLTFQTIWDLVVTAPKLSSLTIKSCPLLPETQSDCVVQFIKENNYNVELKWM